MDNYALFEAAIQSRNRMILIAAVTSTIFCFFAFTWGNNAKLAKIVTGVLITLYYATLAGMFVLYCSLVASGGTR